MEAALHFDAPVQFLMRQAMIDTELRGQQIRKDEIVQVVMGSPNRDSASYENVDEFKLDRARANHHSFGFGIRFCIGAPLAKMDARMAMAALPNNFETVKRAEGQNERVDSHLLREFHHLWLTFSRY